MSDVKRYEPDIAVMNCWERIDNPEAIMEETSDGEWVSYAEYEELMASLDFSIYLNTKLKAENERLCGAIFAIANVNPVIPGSTLAAAVELAGGDE